MITIVFNQLMAILTFLATFKNQSKLCVTIEFNKYNVF